MTAIATKPISKTNQDIGNDELQLVTFSVGESLLGMDIAFVQEINRSMDVTPVPEASSLIHGVINLRGDVVTVVDPHRIFSLPHPTDLSRGRNLILNVEGERIGVLVDSVSDILTIKRSDLSPRPSNIRSIDQRFIQSVYLQEASLIVVLDPVGLIQAIEDV